jgi:hypothetical protein
MTVYGASPVRARRTQAEMEELRQACIDIAASIQPCSVRAICYQLFTRKLIASMSKKHTDRISDLTARLRERGALPWTWIVDPTREVERVAAWTDLGDYLETVQQAYRKDFWSQQPRQIALWSEKSTVAGTLAPVLEEYAVPFLSAHGHASFTAVMQTARDSARLTRSLLLLYVGDFDPSGMHMSEVDLRGRLGRYGGNVEIRRVALLDSDLGGVSTFSAHEKRSDPRYAWFVRRYGEVCAELDALNPNELRARVQEAIDGVLDHEAWERCARTERTERESFNEFIANYRNGSS